MKKVKLSLRFGHPSGQLCALLNSGRAVQVTVEPMEVEAEEITDEIRGLDWFVVAPVEDSPATEPKTDKPAATAPAAPAAKAPKPAKAAKKASE